MFCFILKETCTGSFLYFDTQKKEEKNCSFLENSREFIPVTCLWFRAASEIWVWEGCALSYLHWIFSKGGISCFHRPQSFVPEAPALHAVHSLLIKSPGGGVGLGWEQCPWRPLAVIALVASSPTRINLYSVLPPEAVSNFLSLEERKKLHFRVIEDLDTDNVVKCWIIPSTANRSLSNFLLLPCPKTASLQWPVLLKTCQREMSTKGQGLRESTSNIKVM